MDRKVTLTVQIGSEETYNLSIDSVLDKIKLRFLVEKLIAVQKIINKDIFDTVIEEKKNVSEDTTSNSIDDEKTNSTPINNSGQIKDDRSNGRYIPLSRLTREECVMILTAYYSQDKEYCQKIFSKVGASYLSCMTGKKDIIQKYSIAPSEVGIVAFPDNRKTIPLRHIPGFKYILYLNKRD